MGFFALVVHQQGFPAGARGKEPTCQCRRHKETWVRSLGQEDPPEEGMATHFTVFLPGESQGQRSLVGCCLWGGTESNTTEVT